MKTSYFSKSAATPGAICISRYPPKFWSSLCYKKLAPADYMIRQPSFEKTRQLYYEKVLGVLDPEIVYAELVSISEPYEPILLCYEEKRSECHRGFVSEWFKTSLDITVEEVGEDKSPQMRLF